MRRVLTLLLVAALCSCAPNAMAPRRPLEPPFAAERALLLLLEDRRVFERSAVEELLGQPAPVREMLATALGRIGDPQGRAPLESLLVDGEPAVRRAAAFALGQLKDKSSVAPLLAAAADADRETGTLAVEALGKSGADLGRVETALAKLPEPEHWARLLPALFRFKTAATVPLAVRGLAAEDPDLHARAAYALAREPRPEALAELRSLLADADPWVRAVVARGLGLIGQADDLPRLRALLDDLVPGVVVEALRAGRKLVADGKASADPAWAPRLAALLGDSRPGVAITALEAAGGWLADPTLAGEVRRRASSGSGREREVALLALATAHDGEAEKAVRLAAASPEFLLRWRAAEAAGRLRLLDLLEVLGKDPSPAVRGAALEARLTVAGTLEIVRAGLADPDPIVRATALDWLAERPQAPLAELDAALLAAEPDPLPDAQLSATRAIRARGEAVPEERQPAVARLEALAAGHREFLVRRAAADALVGLGRPRPAIGAASSEHETGFYREAVRQTAGVRRVELRTARGSLILRLECPAAPLTCLSFLKLAGQGFFDGLTFHRVVPDFVDQGGDPRGDGSGGPGYMLRDEINRLRYGRGAVGMALSGPDTGGSQFFLTLSPQPHLDGGYTVFATVERGMDVADRIEQGDRIERIVVLP